MSRFYKLPCAVLVCLVGLASLAVPGSARADGIEPQVVVARALQALEKGKPALAVSLCGQAIEIDPGFAPAYLLRGLIRAREGQDAEAIPDLTRALELGIEDKDMKALAYKWRGKAHLATGQLDAAVGDLTLAIRLTGDEKANFDNYLARALAYLLKDQPHKAVADCNRALRIKPKDPLATKLRDRAVEALGDLGEGVPGSKTMPRLDGIGDR